MVKVYQATADTLPTITLSETAVAYLHDHLAQHADQSILLNVQQKGCSGMSYEFEFIDAPQATMLALQQADLTIYIYDAHRPYLHDLHIDYRQEGISKKMVFTNERATGACGCGESLSFE